MSYRNLIVRRELIDVMSLPVKVYVFKSFVEAFPGRKLYPFLIESIEKAGDKIGGELPPCAIAQPFGFEMDGEPVEGIDIFSLRLTDGWKGNPMYDSCSFENGVYVPKEKGIFCGAGGRIVGREEELRADTEDLQEYLSKWPDIGNLMVSEIESC